MFNQIKSIICYIKNTLESKNVINTLNQEMALNFNSQYIDQSNQQL